MIRVVISTVLGKRFVNHKIQIIQLITAALNFVIGYKLCRCVIKMEFISDHSDEL
jgi:uncharacterized membrane protein